MNFSNIFNFNNDDKKINTDDDIIIKPNTPKPVKHDAVTTSNSNKIQYTVSCIIRSPIEKMELVKFSQLPEWIIPGLQRKESASRVSTIFDAMFSYINTHNGIQLPIHSVTICHADDTFWCIDGQHRLAALKRLLNEHQIDSTVYVNYLKVADLNEAYRLFEMYNQNEPLPTLPDGTHWQMHITTSEAETFREKYPTAFGKGTKRGNRPQMSFVRFTENYAALQPNFEEAIKDNLAKGFTNLSEAVDAYNKSLIETNNNTLCKLFRRSKKDETTILSKIIQGKKAKCLLGMWPASEWSVKFLTWLKESE